MTLKLFKAGTLELTKDKQAIRLEYKPIDVARRGLLIQLSGNKYKRCITYTQYRWVDKSQGEWL